jgi:hypothetical protein
MVIYPGAGHGLYASDHGAVNADILAFIHGRPLPVRHSLPGARDDQAAVRGVSIKT